MKQCVFIIFALYLQCNANVLKSLMYTITIDKIESQMDKTYCSNVSLQIYRDNSETFVNFTVTLVKELPRTATVTIKVLMQDRRNGEYKIYGHPLSYNICQFAQSDKLFYPAVLKKGNFVKSCPVPPGEYYVSNYNIPVDNWPALLPTGNMKIYVVMNNQEDNLVFMVAYGKIEKNAIPGL